MVREIYSKRGGKGVVRVEMGGKIRGERGWYWGGYNGGKGKGRERGRYIGEEEYEEIVEGIGEELYGKRRREEGEGGREKLVGWMVGEGKWREVDYGWFLGRKWEGVEEVKGLVRIGG